jgi:hypothetical protein
MGVILGWIIATVFFAPTLAGRWEGAIHIGKTDIKIAVFQARS